MTFLGNLGRVAAGLCIWLVFGHVPPALATEGDTQQWSTAVVNYGVNDALTLSFTGRMRFNNDISQKKDLLLGPSLAVKAAPALTLGLGYDRIHDYRPAASHENRFWQAVSLRHLAARPALSSRVRLEERLIDHVDKPLYRLRYRLRGTYDTDVMHWYLAASNEVFFNLNSDSGSTRSGFSQNRVFAGLGHPLGERFNIEFGYQWSYADRPGQNLITHAILATLTLDLP